MIRISQIKLHINHSEADLIAEIVRILKVSHESIKEYKIKKKSIDARKDMVKYIYSVDVAVKNQEKVIKKIKNVNVSISNDKKYYFTPSGGKKLNKRPVIVGCGPAGIFCAYMLAKCGYSPIVIERGSRVEERTKIVNNFFNTGNLDTESNVQFGEGGAGTFSDGKLNTMVKDKLGRNDFVLETFVRNGADEKILYVNKPHIGTDVLSEVIKNMRNEAIGYGAEFHFDTKLTDLIIKDNCIHGIKTISKDGKENIFDCEVLVLALGHSARDTFEMIYEKDIIIEPKSFAMGVRIEHPQLQIDESQYGNFHKSLPAADYKLATNLPNGRGVYSFCMCPGGYVVNSSSEKGHLAVNGMSYSKRNGKNANSAMIVTVTPNDFPDNTPLGGIKLQRQLEKASFTEGNSNIPVQLFEDFKLNRKSTGYGDVRPQAKGNTQLSNLRNILPNYMCESLIMGIDSFSTKIKNYNRPDAILSGVESRTSSPLRILRNDVFQSNIEGIYPCGEGAGYAGGITSASMDGIKVFEAICNKYAPLTD